MIRSHKIRLYPNKEQESLLKKAIGINRFTYNWALNQWIEQYKIGLKPNMYKLKKEFNEIKHEQFPWISEVTKCSPESAFFQVQDAYSRFFKKQNKYPKFKKKKLNQGSFKMGNDTFLVENKTIKLPKLGKLKMAEYLRFEGKIITGTVSCKANKWYVSISVEIEDKKKTCDNQAVGIDLGIKTLITCSDGKSFENLKIERRTNKKKKRLNQSLARKKKGSNNFKKQVLKLQRFYDRVTNIKLDHIHNMTHNISSSYDTVFMENLNVSGMLKNRKLSRAIQDVSFGEIERQLNYKCNKIVYVNRFFPSSKLCNLCGYKNDSLTLKDREWVCPNCGGKHDRDLNAAINILNEGNRIKESTVGYTETCADK